MWPFKKTECSENKPVPAEVPPEVVRKEKTQVQSSRVVALLAVLAASKAESVHGKDELVMSIAGDWDDYYNEINPGLGLSIPSSDILTVFAPGKEELQETLFAVFTSGTARRFGKTSKVVQIGLMSQIRPEGVVVRLPVAFVTFVRIGEQEPETIEILDLVKGSIKFV